MINRISNENGVALLISLALILALSALALISADRSTSDIDLSYNRLHQGQAFYLAEAGYQHAFSEIKNDPAWRDGFVDYSFGTGQYTVEVTDSGGDSSLAETLLVVSTGESNGAISIVQAWLLPGVVNPFNRALFGDAYVQLDQDGCTDSYNSDSGTYAATVLNEAGSIGANGYVKLAQDATVNGDVSAATGGYIDVASGVTISGEYDCLFQRHDVFHVPG